MTAQTFDTLKATKVLKKAGFEEAQAEALVSILATALSTVATKADLERLGERLEAKIDRIEERLDAKIDRLGNLMTIRLGALLVAGIGVLIMIDRLFPVGS